MRFTIISTSKRTNLIRKFLSLKKPPEIWPTLPSILLLSIGRQAGEKVERLTLSPDFVFNLTLNLFAFRSYGNALIFLRRNSKYFADFCINLFGCVIVVT